MANQRLRDIRTFAAQKTDKIAQQPGISSSAVVMKTTILKKDRVAYAEIEDYEVDSIVDVFREGTGKNETEQFHNRIKGLQSIKKKVEKRLYVMYNTNRFNDVYQLPSFPYPDNNKVTANHLNNEKFLEDPRNSDFVGQWRTFFKERKWMKVDRLKRYSKQAIYILAWTKEALNNLPSLEYSHELTWSAKATAMLKKEASNKCKHCDSSCSRCTRKFKRTMTLKDNGLLDCRDTAPGAQKSKVEEMANTPDVFGLLVICPNNCSRRGNCVCKILSKGRAFPVALLYEKRYEGWGVRATVDIPAGSFFGIITGEVITIAELIDRNCSSHSMTHMTNGLVFDCKNKGNLTSLVAHSCKEANLTLVCVCPPQEARTSNVQMAMFTFKDVKAGEELTLNYRQKPVKIGVPCFHITDSVKEEIQKSSKLAIIPGGLTKFLQPLDISVNKLFKENLKKYWEEWVSDIDAVEYTKGGRRKKRNYELVATWVLESFNAISTEAVANGFKKALLDELNERPMSL